MDQKQAMNYIDKNGENCPFCGNDAIVTVERGFSLHALECRNCGKSWLEIFDLVGIAFIEDGNYREFRKA